MPERRIEKIEYSNKFSEAPRSKLRGIIDKDLKRFTPKSSQQAARNFSIKSLLKLPRRTQEQAKEKEKVFRENPFNPRLGTHKLHGKDIEEWAFWINLSHRVKFIFLSSNEALFIDIGTHEIYK